MNLKYKVQQVTNEPEIYSSTSY